MAQCGECHWVWGRGGWLAFMSRSQACPRGSAMHQAAGIFLGGGHGCPFDPCPTPLPLAPLALHTWVGGHPCAGRRSTVGSGWWCWNSTLACTLSLPSLEVAAPGAGTRGGSFAEGWGGCLPNGVEQKDPLRRCAHPGRRSLPSEHTSPGSCREMRTGKARPGGCSPRSETDDAGRSFRVFCKPLSKSHFEKCSF